MFGFLKSKTKAKANPKAKTKPTVRNQQRLVSVNFRELKNVQRWGPNLRPDHGYTYKWNLKQEPQVGVWVVVEGMDGLATAIICRASVGVPKGFRMAELKTVQRILTDKEIQHIPK